MVEFIEEYTSVSLRCTPEQVCSISPHSIMEGAKPTQGQLHLHTFSAWAQGTSGTAKMELLISSVKGKTSQVVPLVVRIPTLFQEAIS